MTTSINYSNWYKEITPYIAPPLAASAAMVGAFRYMVEKSALQQGFVLPGITDMQGWAGGLKAAPTVGLIVGAQMAIQKVVERALNNGQSSQELSMKLASSGIVGMASTPFLAIFNGQTMGWTISQTLKKLNLKQTAAISIQEAAFVGGLSVADQLAFRMKRWLGDDRIVDYIAAYFAGVCGGLAGHPANTALTRWQNGLKIDHASQLMWGAARRARGVGLFSVLYKLGTDILNKAAT